MFLQFYIARTSANGVILIYPLRLVNCAMGGTIPTPNPILVSHKIRLPPNRICRINLQHIETHYAKFPVSNGHPLCPAVPPQPEFTAGNN